VLRLFLVALSCLQSLNQYFNLSFVHHRIPILVNPIDNGLEAFDHLIVVPGLARLCQYTGVIPRLSIR